MGRGKIEIRKIDNSKRRKGLLKKAHELADVLCDPPSRAGEYVRASSPAPVEASCTATAGLILNMAAAAAMRPSRRNLQHLVQYCGILIVFFLLLLPHQPAAALGLRGGGGGGGDPSESKLVICLPATCKEIPDCYCCISRGEPIPCAKTKDVCLQKCRP